jgi:hypothetical protein
MGVRVAWEYRGMAEQIEDTSDPRLWKRDGWIAKVIKNEDDDGWAVEMSRHGESEPALTTPWTMGRDKKNPKPLDPPSFHTLVKTAREVLLRHEQQLRARLHRSVSITVDERAIRVDLDIVPDEDDPHAIMLAVDERSGEELRSAKVAPNVKLNATSAARFVKTGEV